MLEDAHREHQPLMDLITSAEMDRRILHSETRIKNWVIGGVLANVIALIVMAIPLVYYLGGIQAQISQASKGIEDSNDPVRRDKLERWQRDREVWESKVDAFMAAQGYPTSRKELTQ